MFILKYCFFLSFLFSKFTLAQGFMIANDYSINFYDLKTLKIELLSINIIKLLHEVKRDYFLFDIANIINNMN